MRFLQALLLCAVLWFTGPSHAQNKPPIACAQAVQMGFDKFVETEMARTKDYTTAGMNSTYDRYRKCKRAANDGTLKVLSSKCKTQIAAARRELDKLETAIWLMVYVEAGGGTMYSQIAAASDATREDVLGNLISATRAKFKKTTPAALKVLWTQAERKLSSHFKTPTNLSGAAFGSVAEDRKRYASATRDAQSAMKALKVLSSQLPPSAAKVLAARVAHSASTSFEIGV